MREVAKSDDVNFIYHDSICRLMSNRAPQLREFATQFDVVIFVSGKQSSNGKYLFSECTSVNLNTYFI